MSDKIEEIVINRQHLLAIGILVLAVHIKQRKSRKINKMFEICSEFARPSLGGCMRWAQSHTASHRSPCKYSLQISNILFIFLLYYSNGQLTLLNFLLSAMSKEFLLSIYIVLIRYNEYLFLSEFDSFT